MHDQHEKSEEYSFWKWFFFPSQNQPSGLSHFFDWYLGIYLFITLYIYPSLPSELRNVACSFMLPIGGIFFGITFAWSGNITALLSTDELDAFSEFVPRGLEYYVYYTQSVVLLVIVLAVSWGAAGLNIITQKIWFIPLLTLTAMTLRECWNFVLMAQYLTLVRRDVARINKQKNKESSNQS